MKRKIISKIKQYETIVLIYVLLRQFYYKWLVSDKFVINRMSKKRLGRQVELIKPIKFNDKIQWLKLNWHDPLAMKCADKYEVRQIVRERIGEEYLNDLIGVYENVDEINIDKLPNKFVLKGTHGSGFNIICTDKDKMNWNKEFKKMKRWLRTNYYYQFRERVYKDIKPRIICEKYIEQEDGEELRDYRFFCFNGEPKFITVDFSINDKSKTRRNLYDMDWSLINAEITYPKELNKKVEKPKKLDELIMLSRKLSKGFPHSRIDFYYINNKIVFGEITFFHQTGIGQIRPSEFEVKMGNWIDLPKKL